MVRSTTSAVLMLSLLTFAICGAGLMCLELLSHYATLAGSIPVQALTLSVLLFAILLVFPVLAERAGIVGYATVRPVGRDPDVVPQPLRLAFSDGILNPKVF